MKKIMFNDRYSLTKAVLEGRKTQTRRIIPDYMQYDCSHCSGREIKKGELRVDFGNGVQHGCRIPYKVGEIVAVAQNYKSIIEDNTLRDWRIKKGIEIEVLGIYSSLVTCDGFYNKMFVKADLMPYCIRITNVKIERLKDISWKDAVKEGIFRWQGSMLYHYDRHAKHPEASRFHTYQEAFAFLIDKVSGKGTWESNPWVLVYDFELVK